MALTPYSYATYQQLLDEGYPSTISVSRTEDLLMRANQTVEVITRNYFREVSGTFTFDGDNSYYLHTPISIISVTSLKINGNTEASDTGEYRVYNGRTPPNDDRRNPKIELRRSSSSSIYTGGVSTGRFQKGYDQVLEGVFGFLEEDDSVPLLITECVIALTIMYAETLYPKFYGRLGQVIGPIVRERTDDHEIEWRSSIRDIPNYIVPKYIQDRLTLYKAPPFVKVVDVRWDETAINVENVEG